MKVLVIEDDVLLNTAIETFFEIKNYDVISTGDGEYALSLISPDIDLYIIDINLPWFNGLDILKFIRSTDIDTPVIIISASLKIADLASSFEFGCSDFIKKPFHFKELEARVNKLHKCDTESIMFKNNFIYNTGEKRFYLNGEVIEFRKKEKRLLDLLMKNINMVVATDNIIDYVWEMEIKQDYTLRQLVNGARKKLPENIIKTHNGIGYEVRNVTYNNFN